jgi:hypothetical protein
MKYQFIKLNKFSNKPFYGIIKCGEDKRYKLMNPSVSTTIEGSVRLFEASRFSDIPVFNAYKVLFEFNTKEELIEKYAEHLI